MRRKDRMVEKKEEVEAILQDCLYCHLCMVDNGFPYAVPMNFGYADGLVYLHAARSGRKLEALQRNNRVFLSFVAEAALTPGNGLDACSLSMRYTSAHIEGHAALVETEAERRTALLAITAQALQDAPSPPRAALPLGATPLGDKRPLEIIRVTPTRLCGKRNPAPPAETP